MKQRVSAPRRQMNHWTMLALLFTAEGALFQFAGSINGFGNNLFATNMGATDTQIGLIQMIPNMVALLLVLPLGILSDRMRYARTMPRLILGGMIAGYVLMGVVPLTAGLRIPMFFLALAFTAGGVALYNAQWQNFFGNVVEVEQRNDILTVRNRVMFLVGIIAPILCGVLMGCFQDTQGKLLILQVFFFLCAAAMLFQFLVVGRTPAEPRASKDGFSLRQLSVTVRELAANRSFMMFFIPTVLFYMAWQFDWSMWYIGQVQYLELTETELSIVSGVFNVGQLVAIGVLSKIVSRRGTDHVFCYAGVGLLMCPLIMITCSLLPAGMRFLPFTVMLTVLNAPQCATNLCVVQILLRVSPRENYSLTVSLYNMTITLTNCIMPLLGVKLYQLLGGDFRAMILFNAVVFVLRIGTLSLLIARYRYLKKNDLLRGEITG